MLGIADWAAGAKSHEPRPQVTVTDMPPQRGLRMKSWAQGLKQWALWLLGEGSLPDKRARKVLAGSLAAVAVLITAAVLASGSSPNTTNVGRTNSTDLAGGSGSGSSAGANSSDNSGSGSTSGSDNSGTTAPAGTSKSAHSRSGRTGTHSRTHNSRSGRSTTTVTRPKGSSPKGSLPATPGSLRRGRRPACRQAPCRWTSSLYSALARAECRHPDCSRG